MNHVLRLAATIVSVVTGVIFIVFAVIMLMSTLNYHMVMSEVLADGEGTTMQMFQDIIESCGIYFGFGFILLSLSALLFTQPQAAGNYEERSSADESYQPKPEKKHRERPAINFRKKFSAAPAEAVPEDAEEYKPVEAPDIRPEWRREDPSEPERSEVSYKEPEAQEDAVEAAPPAYTKQDDKDEGTAVLSDAGQKKPEITPADTKEDEQESDENMAEFADEGTAVLVDPDQGEPEQKDELVTEAAAQPEPKQARDELDDVKALLDEALKGGYITAEDVSSGNLSIEVEGGELKIRKKDAK